MEAGWDTKTAKATRLSDLERLTMNFATVDAEAFAGVRNVSNYMLLPDHVRYVNTRFHMVKIVCNTRT